VVSLAPHHNRWYLSRMEPAHPLANSDRNRAGQTGSAADAAAWLLDPAPPKHKLTYAEQLAAEPQWTGPFPGDEDDGGNPDAYSKHTA
jgi:hypothetical protein